MSYKWNVWSLNFLTFTKSLNKVERKLVFKNKKKQNKKKEMSIFSLGTSLWFFTFFYFTNMVESLGSFWSLRMTFSSGIVIFPSFTCSPSSPSYLLLFFFFWYIYIYDAQFSCFKWSFPKNWTAEREKKTRTRTRNMYIFCFKTIEICFDDAVNCMIASYEWLVPLFHIPLKYYKCSQCVLYT